MTSANEASGLMLAGRPIDIDEAWTRVRRYCGLPWDGNPPETWAFRYFDALDTDPTVVTSEDVVCAGALHPGLSRDDLTYFWDRREELNDWLDGLPVDLTLAGADDSTIALLSDLPSLVQGPSLSLVTKVLHRKRPALIPMIDRAMIDLYRPLTGQRRAMEAWSPLLGHLADDLRTNSSVLTEVGFVLAVELERMVSHLRIVDIAVWMGGRR